MEAKPVKVESIAAVVALRICVTSLSKDVLNLLGNPVQVAWEVKASSRSESVVTISQLVGSTELIRPVGVVGADQKPCTLSSLPS